MRKFFISACLMVGALAAACGFVACNLNNPEESSTLSDGILKYEKISDSDGYEVVGLAENKGVSKLEIPSAFNGRAVLKIADNAFSACRIGKVVLSDSVVEIGANAFFNCNLLEEASFGKGLETVGTSAFEQCIKLEAVELNEGLLTIAEKAFYGCQRLTDLELPDSVTRIGARAYEGCEALTSVVLGDSLEEIGEYAFTGLNDLKTLVFSDVSPTVIRDYAFYSCKGLMKLNIGNGVKAIGKGAFEACSRVNWIVIGDSVATIGENAFRCKEMVHVQLGKSVASIGKTAFYAAKLVEVYNRSALPLRVGGGSEYGYICRRALHVYSEGGESRLSFENDGLVVYDDGVDKILVSQDGTEMLYDLKIPEGITKIHDNAFYDNQRVVKVTIPDSVTEIGDQAFTFCYAMETMIIGDGVETVNYDFVRHNYYLKEIVVGAKVKSFGENSFLNTGRNAEGGLRVYYKGGSLQHLNMDFTAGNEVLQNASPFYYSETEPTGEGAYWHYDEKGAIKVWE